MDISTCTPEVHPTPLPLDASGLPGVQAPTVIADYAMVQGVFLIITLAVLGANFLADMVYTFLDPSVRQERSA